MADHTCDPNADIFASIFAEPCRACEIENLGKEIEEKVEQTREQTAIWVSWDDQAACHVQEIAPGKIVCSAYDDLTASVIFRSRDPEEAAEFVRTYWMLSLLETPK